MLVRNLIVQHGPRFTTVAFPSIYQGSLSQFFEESGVALMIRRGSLGSSYCSLKVCCSSKVAHRLFADWADTVSEEESPLDIEQTEPSPSRRYHYVSASNEVEGPFDGPHIRRLFQENSITNSTLIAAEGETGWVRVDQHLDFADSEGLRAVAISPGQPLEDSLHWADTAKIIESESSPISFGKVMHDFAKTSSLTNNARGLGSRKK